MDDLPIAVKYPGGYLEEDLQRLHECIRSGYHLLRHFQCDMCHFCNMQGRDPVTRILEDERFLANICLD